MFELLYTSVSPAGLSESELTNILDNARLKNHILGITGMLVYHNREIMQILEGEESKVKELYQIIVEDNRHTKAEVLYEGNIEHKAFTGWSMAFKFFDEELIKEFTAGYEELTPESSPISMMKGSPNRGKRAFVSLRNML